MKLQTLFANIGGVVKGVLLIITIIQNYISEALYYIRLSNDILSFEGLNEVNNINKNYKIDKKKQKIGSNSRSNNNDKPLSKLNIPNNSALKNNFMENPEDSQVQMKITTIANQPQKKDGQFITKEDPIKFVDDEIPTFKKNVDQTPFTILDKNHLNFQEDKPSNLEPVTIKLKRKETFTELTYPNFSFTFKEYLGLMFKRGKRYSVFKVVKKYIDKKTSIDHIIKKLHEVDINRFITLEDDHLKWMKMIPGPDINNLYNNKMTSNLQVLWSENEFNHQISASEKGKIQKLLREKSEHDDFEMKLLDLTEKYLENNNQLARVYQKIEQIKQSLNVQEIKNLKI